ncbi:MAG TPA: hypothetical protein VNV66_05510, partial [Pilimelia sp.]|nr:hypothetical protein [Pilimelia sp.]
MRGGAVTVATVLALATALAFTLFGLGAPNHAVAGHDASSWLWSAVKGEMARVNGLTGRVDTRMQVAGAAGHTVQVSQSDRFLVLRDLNTGKVTTVDLATLQSTAALETPTGLGVTIAMDGDAAFIVDTVQGVVRQLDPRTLTPVGEPVRYPPGITGGAFDGDGRLWVAVPTEGTVSAVTPAALEQAPPTAGGVGGGLSPRLVTTVPVAEPSHDLAVSALDDGVAVLDRTAGTLTVLRGEGRAADGRRQVPLRLPGLGALPARTSGAAVPVTVVAERRVYVVTADGVRDFAVPGRGDRLRPAVAWAGRFYAAAG